MRTLWSYDVHDGSNPTKVRSTARKPAPLTLTIFERPLVSNRSSSSRKDVFVTIPAMDRAVNCVHLAVGGTKVVPFPLQSSLSP